MSSPKREPEHSLFRTFSPPQYDLSFVKLPQLLYTEVPVRETVWKDMASFVTPVRIFNFAHEKPAVPMQRTKTKKKRKPKYKPLTGTEVVEMLTKEKPLGEHEFYYMKASEDGLYRPYDLRVVSHSEAGTDYYTNSFTSIIHIQNGHFIEYWNPEEWTRESALWTAVSNIPFFRDYLLRKTFKRWYRNARKATVKSRIDFLPSQLLIAVPQFRDALLHLTRLIEELKQVIWLPHDDLRTYSLLDFQTALLEKNQAAKASLDSYLHCCAAILSKVKNESYQAREELEMKVENSKKFYQSSQSLHLQLTYHRNLQKELSQAEQVLQRLGNLAALAGHMTVQNLVTISKREITAFLNNVLKRDREQQGGLFQTEMVFEADGQLTVFPSLHLLQEVLNGALLSVADSVLQVFDYCSCVEDHIAAKGCEVTGPGNVSSHKERDMPPQTLVPFKMNSLRVQGQRVRGHYQPLPQRLLKWNLEVHVGTQEIQNEQDKIAQEAITEIHQLCESHSWLADVHLFTTQWSSASLETLRGCSPIKYEELIKKLHFWMDRVHNLPPSFTTFNKLFTVEISNIRKEMGCILSTIDEDVLKLLCEDFQTRSGNLLSELKGAVEVMKSKPSTLYQFTVFLNMVQHSERMSGDVQHRLEDLHSLREIVRRNYTDMNPNDIFSMKQVDVLLDQFVLLLKPAAHIVTSQLPSMLDTLDKNITLLVNKLDNLVSRATSGIYLDPDQNPKEMLVQLKALCSQFFVVVEQLNDQSRASKILRGQLLDLTFVTEAQQNMEARKGLWELMGMLSTQICEWKLMKFKKFVVAKAQDKVSEWLQQAEAFAKVIPSHDALLQKTLQILQEFNQLLAVLSKLSSPTLKPKHWRNISKGVDLLYDPEWKLTLADLMSKELLKHQNKINKIFLDAKAEAEMEENFRALQRHWERAEFCHTRFIIAVQQQQGPKLGDVKEENVLPQKHHIIDGGTFTIIGLEALLAQTKESVLTLSDMLRSSHAAEFQQEVKHWLLLLQEQDSAVQNGHWLVLNNCHLLDCWDVRVVNKLTQVVYSTTKDLETDGKLLNAGGTERFVHPQFKLWLITKGDRPHSVPVAVRIRALHLVCDSSWDLKDELWSSVKQTLPFFSHEDTVNTRCVVLHSVLLQRQTFKHLGQGRLYLWTREDLLALIDAHHCITKHCSDPTAAVEYIADSLQPVKYNMTSSTAAYLTSSALLRLETRAAQVIPVGGVIRSTHPPPERREGY
ncbi:hypothetical protein Q8A67_021621 [Cirrhinus molitorella]|uniref:Dynein heavy chain linker domain-containing protein n=1 Tax=Cirrhinus molitorella TaxID=172907 RepID=A0AA88TMY6_9TELE|nr:hypothetical protein Q8A67_021621 [Cirrhinus molitorella]